MISQRILPPVAVIIPVYILFQQVGNTTSIKLLDTRMGMIITYVATNLPLVVWLLRDYFESIPKELEESAAIDGASTFCTFWSVVLPLSVPGLIATLPLCIGFRTNKWLTKITPPPPRITLTTQACRLPYFAGFSRW